MSSIRSFLVGAAACAILVPFTACGGDDGGGDDDDGPGGTPEGTHYGYVVSKTYVPSTQEESNNWSLDIGTTKSDKLDNVPDNALGILFATLKGFGLDVSSTIQLAVDQGKIMLVLDYQTKDFTTASTSGLAIKFGASSTPPACADANDMTCRHHLDGNASIALAANSPTDALVVGSVAGGVFNGGPGDLSIQLALGTTEPILINLKKARAKVTSATDGAITVTIGGAILATDLKNNLIPVVLRTLQGLIAECGGTDPATQCGCTAMTPKLIVTLFDKAPADCKLTQNEIEDNQATKSLLAPDVCVGGATCATADALSVGLKVDGVKATIQ